MAGVERVDVGALISNAQIQGQDKIDEADKHDDQVRNAQKRVDVKRVEIKQTTVQKDVLAQEQGVNQRVQQVIGGQFGAEAANAFGTWQQNQGLQAKLPEALRQQVLKAVAENPQQGTATLNATNTLAQQPGFNNAIRTAPQAATLQKALIDDPKLQKPLGDVLQSNYMQSKKADQPTKNRFLEFSARNLSKGNLDVVKSTGDMLGSINKNVGTRGAERAAMSFASRAPGDAAGRNNVDGFVQQPSVRAMPTFARGKATEILCKANGKSEVSDGLVTLSKDARFKSLSPELKGRTFATIGSGRAGEVRVLTDQTLAAINTGKPLRSGQMSRLLDKMAGQVTRGGADSVDTKQLVKDAKRSPMPSAPLFVSTEGLSDEEAAAVRAQNRGQLLKYFNGLDRHYGNTRKDVTKIKYKEQANVLKLVRPPANIDISALDDANKAIFAECQDSSQKEFDSLKKLFDQKARDVRNKRMPLSKQRAMNAERRVAAKPTKYFTPGAGRTLLASSTGTTGSTTPRGSTLARTPQRATLGQPGQGAININSAQVTKALGSLGNGPLTADKVNVVAQAIAQQVAAQVTAQLLGNTTAPGPAVGIADPTLLVKSEDEQVQLKKDERRTRTDGWGVQRPVDRDLGGARGTPVRAPQAQPAEPAPLTFDQAVNEQYKGRMLVKDPGAIRDLAGMWATEWKSLTKPEQALWKNLGWNQQMWDTKDTPAAKWPVAMNNSFVSLTPTQREAVRKLMSPSDWDAKLAAGGVLALNMGKGA